MNTILEKRLNALQRSGDQSSLAGGLKGLEKESLRITADGHIAQTPHPAGLGSALTHPYITTDYSEALLELITPPHAQCRDTLHFLEKLHQEVYRNLRGETLLASSMPCGINGDSSIPIAQYGQSNIGQMKHIYRRGLGYRYGRAMQAIAGIHFNYSVPENFWPIYQAIEQDNSKTTDFASARYFDLIRNVQRFGWLLLYLFGASPAICKSFLHNRKEDTGQFADFDHYTYYAPNATSLRMSSIGYQSIHQANLNICSNTLDNYVASLSKAIQTPYPLFERIGTFVDGEWRQLSGNILQIENEYYSTIRPKQVTLSGEKPTRALKMRGVRYVEFRALDLNLFSPLGIDETTMHFLEVFALFCLLEESPLHSDCIKQQIRQNQLTTAFEGRSPDCRLHCNQDEISLKEWGLKLCDDMVVIAEFLDEAKPTHDYLDALNCQKALLENEALTPSARILAEMGENGEPFAAYAQRKSEQHESHLRSLYQPPGDIREFTALAAESIEKQQILEQQSGVPFAEFLKQYFKQT